MNSGACPSSGKAIRDDPAAVAFSRSSLHLDVAVPEDWHSGSSPFTGTGGARLSAATASSDWARAAEEMDAFGESDVAVPEDGHTPETVRSLTKAGCGRPRPQHRSTIQPLPHVPRPPGIGALLCPRTGTLRKRSVH